MQLVVDMRRPDKQSLDAVLYAMQRQNERFLLENLAQNRPIQSIYSVSGMRYAREKAAEHWQDLPRLLAAKSGDCEDLAPARAAELVVSGEDPFARAIVKRITPTLWHAVVRRWDGRIEDPSKVLGMSNEEKGLPRLQYKVENRGGLYRAHVRVPAPSRNMRRWAFLPAFVVEDSSRPRALRKAFQEAQRGYRRYSRRIASTGAEVGFWGALLALVPGAIDAGIKTARYVEQRDRAASEEQGSERRREAELQARARRSEIPSWLREAVSVFEEG